MGLSHKKQEFTPAGVNFGVLLLSRGVDRNFVTLAGVDLQMLYSS